MKFHLTENKLNLLMERMANNSLPKSYILPKLLSKGFRTYQGSENNDSSEVTLWYNSTDEKDTQAKIKYLFDLIKRCGWACTSCGGYYDGLRSTLYSIVNYDSEADLYGTYAFNIEPNYPDELENFDKIKQNNDWDYERSKNSLFDHFYDENTLWHLTLKKYLPRIMKNGLMPKNGNSITRWRDTNDRLYLSLIPEVNKVDILDDDEEQDNDSFVLLKVDISNLKGKIKFYEDESYENAVFTYSIIPPRNITIIDNKQLEIMQAENCFAEYFDKMMEKIMEKNSDFTEKELLKCYRGYVKNVLPKLYPINIYKRNFSNNELDKILDRLIDAKLKQL